MRHDPTTYIYTTEFATRAAPTCRSQRLERRRDQQQPGGHHGSYLDLHSGAIDTIAGKTLQIGTSTMHQNVWAGGRQRTIIPTTAGDTNSSWPRHTYPSSPAWARRQLYGGPGSDTFVFNFPEGRADTIGDFAIGQDVISTCTSSRPRSATWTDPVADIGYR